MGYRVDSVLDEGSGFADKTYLGLDLGNVVIFDLYKWRESSLFSSYLANLQEQIWQVFL